MCRTFGSALGRTRTCDLLIRRHYPSETGADAESQGGKKPRLYRVFDTLEQTGWDIGGHPVAVRLRSKPVGSKPSVPALRMLQERRAAGVPPLHGGGQGFESPRLHSRNVDFVIITKRNFLFGWGRGLVGAPSLPTHSANSSTESTSSVRSLRPCYISPSSTWPSSN
jgi:hypothetical protein